MATHPLFVAVLLELMRTPRSGGHVKCWEQFARAATTVPEVDLSIYVLGREPAVERLADNVRFISLRPVLSTARVHGLVGGVDDSDLAPFHPQLARRLPQHHVWHLTHSMTFSATALRQAARQPRPLTASVHTDVPMLTRMYTRQIVQRLPGALRSAAQALRVEDRAAAVTRRHRDRVLRASSHILASNVPDAREFAAVAPRARISMLRRGVDTSLFSPERADRAWLARRYGVPEDQHLLLFAGRIDVTKGAPLLAEAVRRVRSTGSPVHLVMAGSGAATGQVSELLGPHATLLGHLPQEELARVYASCDAMALPSRSETVGNVVAEAMAAGLPVLLPRGERTAQWVSAPGEDGVLVPDHDAGAWASVIGNLFAVPERLRSIGRRARSTIERGAPTWRDVLMEDLVPVWQAAVAAGRPRGPAGPAPVSVPDRVAVAVSR